MNWDDLAFALGAVAAVGVAWGVILQPLWSAARGAALGLCVLLLGLAAVAYAAVGRPGMWGDRVVHESAQSSAAAQAPGAQGPGDAEAQVSQAQIEGMVQRLSERLQRNPDDAAGWRMLVRSYETLGRFDEAVKAWERLFQIAPPDADQLTEYAVTLGMSQGQRLAGEPEKVLEAVLQREPNHVQALALSGSAAFERHDYARAIERWQRLLKQAPADEDVRQRIGAQIDKARELAKREAAEGAR